MDAVRLSKEFADSVLPVTIFIGLLALFGIVGNISVLYIYKYKYPTCIFRTFVICLATADLFSCLFVFPCEIVGHRMWFSYPTSAAWFCKLKTTVFGIAFTTTSLILLLIAVDRYKKVCRPFGSQIKPSDALRLCVICLGIAVLLTVPVPVLFGVQTENITYAGERFEITSCEKDDAFKDTSWMIVYLVCMYFTPVISFMATTSVLYSIILKKMYSRTFLSKPSSTTQRNISNKMGEKHDGGKSANVSGMGTGTANHSRTDHINYLQEGYIGTGAHVDVIKSENTGDVTTKHEEAPIKSSQVNSRKIKLLHTNPIKTATCTDLQINQGENINVNGTDTDLNEMEERRVIIRDTNSVTPKQRVTRKTTIMFVVTLIFNITTLIYFSVLFVIVRKQHIFEVATKDSAGLLFLGWRIYFINHVINPVVYGLLDQRFRMALQKSSTRV